MTLRRLAAVLAVAIVAIPGTATAAHYDTINFAVDAPTPELAKTFGETAEFFRKQKANEWLGREMPQWQQRCPLRVRIVQGSAGGATTFSFGSDGGRPIVVRQEMEIRGEVRQLLNSVLPHEVTHTVLAHHFGRPVPRWADEGGSVLSENNEERFNHDVRCRELLNAGRGIPLRSLFRMTEYPRDMIVLYAQGFSVCDYLVKRGGDGREGRGQLLRFLEIGMNGNTTDTWNSAARQIYQFDTLDAMQEAWMASLHTPPTRVAARGTANGTTTGSSKGYDPISSDSPRMEVRSSAPPALPVLEPPVRAARGVAPAETTPLFPSERGQGMTVPAPVRAPARPAPVLLPPTIPAPE